ncbi:hypothetical protein [Clostridium tyrobutyricum]|uniref:hypothetical protein n=1 Tax=Clostridium tyrobutyricum TaxID=1519 RepID=UPI000300BEC0|nr:hypothetical protein [Clostridium tyrobutyricum]
MERTVEEILMNYKSCTKCIIELLKKEEFNSLQNEMEKRQYILDELISNSDKKSESKKIYEKMNIEEIEVEADKLMQNKALMLKKKLKDIAINKTASSAYGNLGSSAKIFSKKI